MNDRVTNITLPYVADPTDPITAAVAPVPPPDLDAEPRPDVDTLAYVGYRQTYDGVADIRVPRSRSIVPLESIETIEYTNGTLELSVNNGPIYIHGFPASDVEALVNDWLAWNGYAPEWDVTDHDGPPATQEEIAALTQAHDESVEAFANRDRTQAAEQAAKAEADTAGNLLVAGLIVVAFLGLALMSVQ